MNEIDVFCLVCGKFSHSIDDLDLVDGVYRCPRCGESEYFAFNDVVDLGYGIGSMLLEAGKRRDELGFRTLKRIRDLESVYEIRGECV